MNNYPLNLINLYKNDFRKNMSATKYRTTLLKLLMLSTGPLSTTVVKQALRLIDAPDELADDNIRQVISRIHSDNDFLFDKNESDEYVTLDDPISAFAKLSSEKNPFINIDSDTFANFLAETPVPSSTDGYQLIFNNFSAISNLMASDVANSFNGSPISTIQFSNYNKNTDTSSCIINAGDHTQHNLISIATDLTDGEDNLITEKAARSIDRLNICYPYKPADLCIVPDIRQCNVCTCDLLNEEKVIKSLLLKSLHNGRDTLILFAKIFETEYPTISDFIQHIYDLTDSLSKKTNIESEHWFLILKLLEPYGDTPTSELNILLNRITKNAEPSLFRALQKKINEETNEQKKLMYEYLSTKYNPLAESFTLEPGIPSGQMVIFESPIKLLSSIPYLHTCDLSFDLLPTIFKNIGMNFWSYNTIFHEWPLRTLALECMYKDGLPNPLHLRNAMKLNGCTVAIENISADIGGLMRVSHFLNTKMGRYRDILLIALVSDDYMLADGKHLFESKSLYQKPISNTHELTLSATSRNIFHFLFSQKYNHRGNHKYLPFYRTDIAFLTYSQFEEAKHTRVYPWIYNYESEEFIHRGL